MLYISVVVTFYNKGILLKKAIESVIGQLCQNDEIVVVNDCSSEKTSKTALDDAKHSFPRVRFFETSRNRGSAFAKDFGIRHSKNEIIVLLDADDVIPEISIKRIREKFEEDKTIALVFGNYTYIRVENKSFKTVDCIRIANDGFLDPYKLAKNWILLGTSPFRKAVYFDVGGFDILHPKTDDMDFHRKLLLKKYKCAYLNKNIYCWNRTMAGNNSSYSAEDYLFSFFRGIEFYYTFLNKRDFFIQMTFYYFDSLFQKFFNFSLKRLTRPKRFR